jgi:hypothetical protein
MSYVYTEERPRLFDEDGVEVLSKVRRNVQRALEVAGAVRAMEAMTGVTGDDWLMLAALDYMVEKGEIREVTNEDQVWGQHRVFVGPS